MAIILCTFIFNFLSCLRQRILSSMFHAQLILHTPCQHRHSFKLLFLLIYLPIPTIRTCRFHATPVAHMPHRELNLLNSNYSILCRRGMTRNSRTGDNFLDVLVFEDGGYHRPAAVQGDGQHSQGQLFGGYHRVLHQPTQDWV